MTTLRRWCLRCFEDFAEDLNPSGFCMCCQYEADRAVVLSGMTFGKRNNTPDVWWGPTLDDVDPEDISDGYYVASIGLQDSEFWEV